MIIETISPYTNSLDIDINGVTKFNFYRNKSRDIVIVYFDNNKGFGVTFEQYHDYLVRTCGKQIAMIMCERYNEFKFEGM